MILMYHKVDVIAPTLWWVRVSTFERQLAALADRDVVPLDQYRSDNPRHCVITFDDAYEDIYRHVFPMLRERGWPFEIFVIGNAIGKWSGEKSSEPRTRYASREQLLEMAAAGARIQWHTRDHRRLLGADPALVAQQLEVPQELRRDFPAPHLRWFAYPYGSHDLAAVAAAKLGFIGALSVMDGSPDDRYQWNRVVVDDSTDFELQADFTLMRNDHFESCTWSEPNRGS